MSSRTVEQHDADEVLILKLQVRHLRAALREIDKLCNEAIGEDAHRDNDAEAIMEIWRIASERG